MVEKTQRPIGGERREPQRQARELDSHRIQIDAVETSLGDGPADGDACRFVEIAGRAGPSRTSARSYACARKRQAATRNAPLPIAGSTMRSWRIWSGARVARERTERPPHEIVGNRLRRVERSGGLAHAGAGLERDDRPRHASARGWRSARHAARSRAAFRTPRPVARRRGRDTRCVRVPRDRTPARVESASSRPPRRLVVQVAPLGKRRSRRRKEPAVERRHAQVAGLGNRRERGASSRGAYPTGRARVCRARRFPAAHRRCSCRDTPDATAARARGLRRTAGKSRR